MGNFTIAKTEKSVFSIWRMKHITNIGERAQDFHQIIFCGIEEPCNCLNHKQLQVLMSLTLFSFDQYHNSKIILFIQLFKTLMVKSFQLLLEKYGYRILVNLIARLPE